MQPTLSNFKDAGLMTISIGLIGSVSSYLQAGDRWSALIAGGIGVIAVILYHIVP